jgi:hypothetical protein
MKLKGFAITILIAVPLLLGVSAGGASTKSGTPAQVAAAVAASTSITSIPKNLTPSLSLFSNPLAAEENGGMHSLTACDPYEHAGLVYHPVPCFFGDLKSKKTFVLVGDSNVGQWAPALAMGLATSKYRMADFPYPGCSTPDIVYTTQHQLNGTTPAHCNAWHKAVLKAIRALHPFAVILVSAPFGSTSGATESQWVAGMQKMFAQATLGAPKTLRILFGTSPGFPGPVPTCLVSNSNPQTCAVANTPSSIYGGYLSRDQLIATAASATLIPVEPWLCNGTSCSPIISKYLVYVDSDHISIAFSQFASQVVTNAVVKVLKGP